MQHIFGDGLEVAPEGDTVEDMLSYTCPRSATTFAGHHWIFDWDAANRVMACDDNPSADRDWSVFVLGSVTNHYGFAFFRPSQATRRRAGSSEDGILIEAAPLADAEKRALAIVGASADPDGLIAAWSDPTKTVHLPDIDCEVSHDALGEDVVLELIRETTGVDMDAFLEQPVQRVHTPREVSTSLRSLWDRLLGR